MWIGVEVGEKGLGPCRLWWKRWLHPLRPTLKCGDVKKCGDVARGAQNVGTSKNVGTSSVAPKMWGRHIGRKNVGTSTECGDVVFRENVGTSVDVPTFLAGVP